MKPGRIAMLVALLLARMKRDGFLPIRGDQGDKGDRGDQGERGPRGDKGDCGDQGMPGRDGVDGHYGAPGQRGDRGERGAKGDHGEIGRGGGDGAKGPKGDKGEKGDQGLNWRGPFKPGFLYDQDDGVFYEGSSWIAKRRTDGVPGRSTAWDMLAQKGFDGVSFGAGESGGAGVTDHGALTGLADDDHPQYQLRSEKGAASGYASLDGAGTVPDAQIPASIARDAEVTAAIAAHEAAGDPHPGYLTAAEGDALFLTPAEGNAAYEVAGAVAAHAGAADPHTGYQKESEKGAANGYAGLGVGGLVPMAQLASGAPDGTKFIRDDGTLQAVTATTPDLVLTKRSATADQTVPAGYSAMVVGDYEIASGFVLELAADGVLEIA